MAGTQKYLFYPGELGAASLHICRQPDTCVRGRPATRSSGAGLSRSVKCQNRKGPAQLELQEMSLEGGEGQGARGAVQGRAGHSNALGNILIVL